MYQFCHHLCINPVTTPVSVSILTNSCINPIITPASVSIRSLLLHLYQSCHLYCINSVITPVSILSSFLYQFCHRSCINSVNTHVSLYQSCQNSCINPHCCHCPVSESDGYVQTERLHSYPPAGIHFHVGLTWMLDLNLSAAAYDLPFVIVLVAIPIGCY